MADKKKPDKPTNVKYLKTVQGKKKPTRKNNSARKGTPTRSKSKADIFITDDRFKRAMELVQNDMNRTLSLSQTANSQFYFLFQFLVKNDIINKNEYEKFLNEELNKVQSSDESG